MSPVAFLDANVPIFAAGREHPLKQPCAEVLRLASDYPMAFITDAEVLQELLHHYLAVRLWVQGRVIFEEFAEIMRGRVEAIHARDVELGAKLASGYPQLESRDLIHAAIVDRLGLKYVVSADKGFDRLPNIQRLDPADWQRWRASVLA